MSIDTRPPVVTRPPAHPTTRLSAGQRAARVRFRRALSFMAMTLVLPGSAQLVAGNRTVGKVAIRAWLGLWVLGTVTLTTIAVNHGSVFWFASNPTVLLLARFLLIALALGWGALFLDAWRIGNPRSLELNHRRATLGISTVLCLAVATVFLFGAHLVSTQRGLVMTMFAGRHAVGTSAGRYNVLLLGGDSGVTRWGLRTDSMTIASIDAVTGKTVLVGLPRNMTGFPFKAGSIMAKQFPDGYNCSTCELNSLSTYAADHKSLFEKYDEPGVEATIEGIEGITGLKISYWSMINMPGFRDLVNAVGGVTMNIRQPIAVGPTGHVHRWIKPGVRKLSGEALLWYARSRATSDDYSRMARQKCVMNAMLHQVSPTTVLKHFSQIANATESLLQTDIPSSEVGKFATLALKAKGQKISTVSLVPPLVNTSKPDLAVIHDAISKAIDPPAKKAAAKQQAPAQSGQTSQGGQTSQSGSAGSQGTAATPPPSTQMTEGSFGSLKTGYVANATDDLGAAC